MGKRRPSVAESGTVGDRSTTWDGLGSLEHAPPHVHVFYGREELLVSLGGDTEPIGVRTNRGMKPQRILKALEQDPGRMQDIMGAILQGRNWVLTEADYARLTKACSWAYSRFGAGSRRPGKSPMKSASAIAATAGTGTAPTAAAL